MDFERIKQAILIMVATVWIFYLLFTWFKVNTGEQRKKDYESSKPLFYVYYQTSGISIPMGAYLIGTIWISLLIGLGFANLMNNLFAGLLLSMLLIFQSKQYVQSRSIKRSQIIDEKLPEYLHAFYNVYQHKSEPLFSLEYANRYAPTIFKKEFEDFHTRLVNNADPIMEIEKMMFKFKNPIIQDFLSAFATEIYEGFGFNERLERLIERAENRKDLATERRINTYSNVMTIRTGIIFFFVVAAIFFLVKPAYLGVFQHNILGQFAVNLMILTTGMLSMVSRSLILLSEG